jgi:hypothetical protein
MRCNNQIREISNLGQFFYGCYFSAIISFLCSSHQKTIFLKVHEYKGSLKTYFKEEVNLKKTTHQ